MKNLTILKNECWTKLIIQITSRRYDFVFCEWTKGISLTFTRSINQAFYLPWMHFWIACLPSSCAEEDFFQPETINDLSSTEIDLKAFLCPDRRSFHKRWLQPDTLKVLSYQLLCWPWMRVKETEWCIYKAIIINLKSYWCRIQMKSLFLMAERIQELHRKLA